MQIICTLLQTDNHANTSPLGFIQARCPFYNPTNSVKELKDQSFIKKGEIKVKVCVLALASFIIHGDS